MTFSQEHEERIEEHEEHEEQSFIVLRFDY